jgi:hypothetical protein
MADNTGIPEWECIHCNPKAHVKDAVSIPEGIDFSTQNCKTCDKPRTDHLMNGCGGWCCCLCPECPSV